jgi:hypothetical protein
VSHDAITREKLQDKPNEKAGHVNCNQ